jgi:hypothetical protein
VNFQHPPRNRAAAIAKCVAADDITQPRERPGDSMSETTQRETPHVGIFWVVQTSNGEAKLLAAGCPLDQAEPYGRLSNLQPGAITAATTKKNKATTSSGSLMVNV